MKKFKSLSEMRKYYSEKSLRSYHKIMADPIKAEEYRAKRRIYEKKRRQQMIKELKDLE